MYVIKRKGNKQEVDFNKILKRIQYLTKNPTSLSGVNTIELTQQIIRELHDDISTIDIDIFTAKLAATLQTKHLDYGKLAGRIAINNHQKNTLNSFLDKMTILYLRKDVDGKSCPLISDEFYKFVVKNKQQIENKIDYDRDYYIDFFGFKTLEQSYLLKIDNRVIERPQDLWMRVAIFVHFSKNYYDKNNLEKIFKTYDAYSNKLMIQASPTLFNSGSNHSQNFSCVDENTLVNTTQGMIPIKDIQIGNEVVTHLGNIKKVLQIHKNPIGDRNFYEINITNTTPIKITDNHNLWVLSNNKPQWKAVKDLTKDDFIAIPNYIGNKFDPELNHIGNIDRYLYIYKIFGNKMSIKYLYDINNIKIDEKYCKFLGLWYRNGHIIKRKNTNGSSYIGGICITINIEKNMELIWLCKSMEDVFGIDHSFHVVKNKNIIQISFHSHILGLLFAKLYEDGDHAKFGVVPVVVT